METRRRASTVAAAVALLVFGLFLLTFDGDSAGSGMLALAGARYCFEAWAGGHASRRRLEPAADKGSWRRRLDCKWVEWKHKRVCDEVKGSEPASGRHPFAAAGGAGSSRSSSSISGGSGSAAEETSAGRSDGPVFSGVGRIAVCMTGQVRSLEEVNGNIRDMVVRPLQALVDLPPFADQQPANASSPQPPARRGIMAAADESVGRAAPASRAGAAALRVMSNVHLYATLALQDTLEGKGFDCAKSVHPRPKVA